MISKRHQWTGLVAATLVISLLNVYLFIVDKTVLPNMDPARVPIETTCPSPSLSVPQQDTQTFQPIAGSAIYVYSAFLDKGKVRVIGLKEMKDASKVFCQLWSNMSDNETLFVVRANVHTISEHHGRPFTASYILCNLPSQMAQHPPYAVSVVTGETCANPSNRLVIHTPQPKTVNFTVCIAPINNNYNKTHDLVEMIEFNRILGAEKFVFYNYSMNSRVAQILLHYNALGLVEILKWQSPHIVSSHYYGQLAALNDCLYRYGDQSQYLVYQDIDEFIVPTGSHFTWAELVAARTKLRSNVAVFQAKCTFFRKEWPQPLQEFRQNAEVMKYHSVVLAHTLRESKIFGHNQRSKYIINPKLVETVGIHFVWTTTGFTDKLPEDVSLLYHYRDWGAPNDSQLRVGDGFVVRKYGTVLVDRLAKAWQLIKDRMGLTWEI